MNLLFTIKRLVEIVDMDEDIGVCIECGAEQDGVEPDAQNCECAVCGKAAVYGAVEILLAELS